MVRKIVWSPEAIDTYIAAIEYLEHQWSKKEVNTFITRVSTKLEILKKQPLLGRKSGKRKNTHRTLINKRITLVYYYKPIKKEIELVSFLNNWRKPGKFE